MDSDSVTLFFYLFTNAMQQNIFTTYFYLILNLLK